MWGLAWWLIMAALCSCMYDHLTYDNRQLKWERLHPGATYTPGYRKKAAEAAKIYEKYQREKENGNG